MQWIISEGVAEQDYIYTFEYIYIFLKKDFGWRYQTLLFSESNDETRLELVPET